MRTSTKVMASIAAAAGAAAAGYYFYASKNAKKNRQVVAKWASDFKRDVEKQADQLKNLNRESLVGIVDGVTKAYETVRNIDRNDLMKAAEELKRNWRLVKDEVMKARGSMGATMRTKKRKTTRSRK